MADDRRARPRWTTSGSTTSRFDNILWALDRNNGGLKWHQPLSMRPSGGPLVLGDVVVVAGVAAEVHGFRALTGDAVGKSESPADLASRAATGAGDAPPLTAVALVTRAGVFMLLTRRVEPAATALPYPLGTDVPLSRLGAAERRARSESRRPGARPLPGSARASGCEKHRRSVLPPLPSTKNAPPAT